MTKIAGAAHTASLWEIWERTQHRIGDKIVAVEAADGAEWSAARLHAAALARAPQLEPFRPGQRVAFRLPNGPGWLALFLALQRAGLAALPLDGGLPPEGCVELARRLGAAALFLDLDGTVRRFRHPAPGRRGIALVKLTSGTTGEPKAIECRASHLIADGTQIVRTMGIGPADRNLAAIPFGHSYGIGNLVMPLLLQGTAVVAAQAYVPRQLLEWIGRHRVTVLPGVPALFRVLAGLPEGTPLAPLPLRLAISAGAPLSAEVARAFHDRFGLKVHNFYGSSETGGICYDRTGAASLSGRSVGKPLRGVLLEVKSGALTVSGPAVVGPRGCRRLADRGEWNRLGELVLLGRSGPGANIGGKKVHPGEVERILRALPGVSDAAVWTVSEGGRDLLAAAVETARTRPDLERALAEKLPEWKLPKRYFLAPALPRNSRGKLDMAALRR